MLLAGKDESDLSMQGNQFLEYLRVWSENNCLKVNAKKSNAIIFRPKNKTIQTNFDLMLGSSKIEIVPAVKCLGVVFTETLSWDVHIDNVRRKMNLINGVLCRHRYTLPMKVKVLIYNAYLLPIMSYCLTIWGTTTKQNTQKQVVAQKRAIRLIANLPWNSHTHPYFKQYGILRIHALYPFKLLCMYKNAIITNNEPLLTALNLHHYTPAYNVRHHLPWRLPFCRTLYRKQSLSYNVSYYLNILAENNVCLEDTSRNQLSSMLLDFETTPLTL